MTLDPGGFGWWLGTGKDATAGCGRGCEQPLLVLIALLEVPETAERWDLGLNTSCGRWAMTTTSISPSKRTEIDISGRSFRVCKKKNQAKTDNFLFFRTDKAERKLAKYKKWSNIGFYVIVLIFSKQSSNTELHAKQSQFSVLDFDVETRAFFNFTIFLVKLSLYTKQAYFDGFFYELKLHWQIKMNKLEYKENKKRCNIIDCVMAVLVVATVITFILILYVIHIFTLN